MAVPPYRVMKPLLRFCRTVVNHDVTPMFVKVQPAQKAEPNECFENVRLQVEKEGGDIQHGWAMWEWPKVYFEAEFHCVWKNGAGELIDITPNTPPYPWILFLPDSNRVYKNRLVDNIRKPLVRDVTLNRFYDACKQWHQMRRLQYEPGFVETEEWLSAMRKLFERRSVCDQQMLMKFGHLLKPAIRHRMSSPMPSI